MSETHAANSCLFTGIACNNNCIFCAQGVLREEAAGSRAESPADLLGGARGGVETVYLVGGEPTLHEGLAGLIRDARSAGARSVVVQTNARRLAYTAYTRELVDAGLTAAEISLHGPRGDIHDYHTRAPGSFRQAARGIRNAKAAGLRVGMTTVVTRSNFRHLGEQAALAARLGVDALCLALARPWGAAGARFQGIVPRWTAVLPQLAAAAARCRRTGIPLVVSGMPLCLLSGIDACPMELEERGAVPPLGLPDRRCGDCALRPVCAGVDERYAARYGTDELRPVERDAAAGFTRRSRGSPGGPSSLFAGPRPVESGRPGG